MSPPERPVNVPRLALNVIVPVPVDNVRSLFSAAWLSMAAQCVKSTLPPAVVICQRCCRVVTGPLIRVKLPSGRIDGRQCSASGVDDDSAADRIVAARSVALAQVDRTCRIDELDRAAVVVGHHAVGTAERDLACCAFYDKLKPSRLSVPADRR